MADQEREVRIVITSKNLTGPQIEAAQKALDDLGVKTRLAGSKAKELKSDWDSLSSGVSKLNGLLGGFGLALSVGAVVGFGKSIFDAASRTHDMAIALGFSSEAYQRNAFAAEQSGGSTEAFTKAAQKLNDNLANGDKSTVGALKAAGLQFSVISAMKPEEAWEKVTDAVGKIEDPMVRAKVAQDLFGKGALTLLPGMIEGYKKIGEAATVMSNETVDRLEAAQDAWDGLWSKITILSGEAISGTMKGVSSLTSFISGSGMVQQLAEVRDAAKEASKAAGTDYQQELSRAMSLSKSDMQSYVNKYKDHSESVKTANEGMSTAAKIRSQEEVEADKKAEDAIAAYSKKLDEAADVLTGRALARHVKELADEVKRAGGESNISAYQMDVLGKQLDEVRKQGGKLTPELFNIWRQTHDLNSATLVHIATQKDLVAAFGGTATAISAIRLPVSVMTADFMAFVNTTTPDIMNALDHIGTKMTTLPQPPPPLPGPWDDFRDRVSGDFQQLGDNMGTEFGRMLLHVEGWKEGFGAILGEVKQTFSDILGDMIGMFTSRFMSGLVNSILDGKNEFGSAFSGMLSGLKIPTVKIPVEYGSPGSPPSAGGSSGGSPGSGSHAGQEYLDAAAATGVIFALGKLGEKLLFGGQDEHISEMEDFLRSQGISTPERKGQLIFRGFYEKALQGIINGLASSVGGPTVSLPDSPDEDGGHAAGTGGRFLNFGSATRTTLHGYEAVVRPADTPSIADQIASALGRMLPMAPGSSGSPVINLNITIGNREIKDFSVDAVQQGLTDGRVSVPARNIVGRSVYA